MLEDIDDGLRLVPDVLGSDAKETFQTSTELHARAGKSMSWGYTTKTRPDKSSSTKFMFKLAGSKRFSTLHGGGADIAIETSAGAKVYEQLDVAREKMCIDIADDPPMKKLIMTVVDKLKQADHGLMELKNNTHLAWDPTLSVMFNHTPRHKDDPRGEGPGSNLIIMATRAGFFIFSKVTETDRLQWIIVPVKARDALVFSGAMRYHYYHQVLRAEISAVEMRYVLTLRLGVDTANEIKMYDDHQEQKTYNVPPLQRAWKTEVCLVCFATPICVVSFHCEGFVSKDKTWLKPDSHWT